MEFQNKIAERLLGFRRTKDEGDDEPLSTMYGRLISIAWPAALEGALITLMNSFDTMMVGKLGSAAITSVGLCAQPRMILLLLAQSLCTGTTAVIARRRGEGNQAAALSTLKQSLAVITVLGILMTFGGYLFAEPLVRLAGAASDTVADATIYFQIISLAFIPNCWALCICAGQRGIGKTRITMTTNMISNGVNIILNYCLINGHFGFPALGIRGAAIATAIGTCVSCIAAVVVVMRKGGYLSLLPWTGFRFDKATLSSLVTVGSGTIAESVFMRIGFLINGKLIAGVSTEAYATNQIVMQITGLTFMLGDGVASACTALIGQSLGANKKNKARAYVKVGTRLSLFMSIAIVALTFFARNLFPTFFSDDPKIIEAAALCFIVILIGIYPQNMRVVISGCLRGAGDVKFVALVSLISVAVLRPLLTWFFSYPLDAAFPTLMLGFIGNWLSFNVDAFVRWIMLQIRVDKGKWVDIRI